MKALLTISGIAHVAEVRKDSNKTNKVARVHTLSGEPVLLLKEVSNNKFLDDIENKHYLLNPMTRVIVGA